MPKAKGKGANFERTMCRKLSMWISYGERDDLFWRTAMSGGRATVKLAQGKKALAQAGDMTAIDPLGMPFHELFFTEFKHYNGLEYHQLVLGANKGRAVKFWKKTCAEAKKYDKYAFMVTRQNYLPDVLWLQEECILDVLVNNMAYINSYSTAKIIPVQARLFLLDTFLEVVPPEWLSQKTSLKNS